MIYGLIFYGKRPREKRRLISDLMMRPQLFSRTPTMDLVSRLLVAYGLKDLQDDRTFTKRDLVQRYDTIDILTTPGGLLDELRAYYRPCKAPLYLSPSGRPDLLDGDRAITILRQVLRCIGLRLDSRELNNRGKKMVQYRLVHPNAQSTCMSKTDINVTLSFK